MASATAATPFYLCTSLGLWARAAVTAGRTQWPGLAAPGPRPHSPAELRSWEGGVLGSVLVTSQGARHPVPFQSSLGEGPRALDGPVLVIGAAQAQGPF